MLSVLYYWFNAKRMNISWLGWQALLQNIYQGFSKTHSFKIIKNEREGTLMFENAWNKCR